MKLNRRDFIKGFGAFVAGLGLGATKAEAKEVEAIEIPSDSKWGSGWQAEPGETFVDGFAVEPCQDFRFELHSPLGYKLKHEIQTASGEWIDFNDASRRLAHEWMHHLNECTDAIIERCDPELTPDPFDAAELETKTQTTQSPMQSYIDGFADAIGCWTDANKKTLAEFEAAQETEPMLDPRAWNWVEDDGAKPARASACDDCPNECFCELFDETIPRAETALRYGCINDDGTLGPEHELPVVLSERAAQAETDRVIHASEYGDDKNTGLSFDDAKRTICAALAELRSGDELAISTRCEDYDLVHALLARDPFLGWSELRDQLL